MKDYLREKKEGWPLESRQAIREQEGVTKKELEGKWLKISLSPLFFSNNSECINKEAGLEEPNMNREGTKD